MFASLPLGPARLERPQTLIRYTFEHFLRSRRRQPGDIRNMSGALAILPIEAVAAGDVQVLAACESGKEATPVVDLDVLSGFPSVESVVASTRLVASRPLPHIRELLLYPSAPLPNTATLRNLTGLQALYAQATHGNSKLDLDALDAAQMRKLAFNRWLTGNLEALKRMTGLEQLSADLFREPLDALAGMTNLTYLSIRGPAKGWAKLRNCTLLEEAHLIDVEIANLRRWNTWKRLRTLTLSGRGLKSLTGLESCEQLQELTLLNTRTNELASLRELSRLTSLTLRMPAAGVDLESVAAIPQLRSLVVDDASITDCDVLRIPALKLLAKAYALQEVTLFCAVEDRDLTPLAELPGLQRLRLASWIGADVDTLRRARPDLQIEHTPPDPKWDQLKERIGEITIQRPCEGQKQWSLYESVAQRMNVATNYAAESMIRKEVKKRDPELAKRIGWDTEGGAVGIRADAESDIRAVADIMNDLLKQ